MTTKSGRGKVVLSGRSQRRPIIEKRLPSPPLYTTNDVLSLNSITLKDYQV